MERLSEEAHEDSGRGAMEQKDENVLLMLLRNRPPRLGAFNQPSFLRSLMVWGTNWAQLGSSGSKWLKLASSQRLPHSHVRCLGWEDVKSWSLEQLGKHHYLLVVFLQCLLPETALQ